MQVAVENYTLGSAAGESDLAGTAAPAGSRSQ